MIDTHSHMYSEQFNEDRAAAINRSQQQGIEFILLPNIDVDSIEALHSLADTQKNCLPMMGLHPCSVDENVIKSLSIIKHELFNNHRKYIAVGEIGIDLYWDQTFLKQQQEAFNTQIRWAKEYELPIVIHCRDAFDEVFEILEDHRGEGLSGIFHCFTGTKDQADRAIDLNLKLGIGGVVTFKNGKIDQFLDQISPDHIVLETDAPYLAPVPFRGKRNQSEYLVHILQKLALIYRRSVSEIATITSKNALSVFKI